MQLEVRAPGIKADGAGRVASCAHLPAPIEFDEIPVFRPPQELESGRLAIAIEKRAASDETGDGSGVASIGLGDNGLESEARSVAEQFQMQSKVAIRMDGLLFPPQCAACGAEGAVPLRITKAFLRGDDDEEAREEVLQFEVKLCASCASRHQSEKRERSLFDWLRQAFSDPGTALGASIVGGVGCLFLWEALKKASLALLLFSLLPLLIAYYLFRVSWNKEASKFLPPPTSVSSCVDFSDFQHRQYEPVWLHFYFRSPKYAEAFRQLNASRLWDPAGGEAVAARQKRAWMEKRNRWLGWLLGILLVGFGILSWLLGWDS